MRCTVLLSESTFDRIEDKQFLFCLQADVLPKVLETLNWTELARLLIACDNAIMPLIQGNIALREKIFSPEGVNSKEIVLLPELSSVTMSKPPVNFKSVSDAYLTDENLDGFELFNARLEIGGEYRAQLGPELLRLACRGPPRTVTCASFNPKFPLLAAGIRDGCFVVHRLAGEKRFTQGSKIYEFCMPAYNSHTSRGFIDEHYPEIMALSWSPDGTVLMVYTAPMHYNWLELHMCGMDDSVIEKRMATILLFEFNQRDESMHLLQVCPGDLTEHLTADLTMSSHHLWTGDRQFIVASPKFRAGLYLCNILEDEGVAFIAVKSLLENAHWPFKGIKSEVRQIRKLYPDDQVKRRESLGALPGDGYSFVGCYVGLTSSEDSVTFGYVTSCPWKHEHCRVVVQTKATTRTGESNEDLQEGPESIIEVPGHMLTLSVQSGELYIVYMYDTTNWSPDLIYKPRLEIFDSSKDNYERFAFNCHLLENEKQHLGVHANARQRVSEERKAKIGICRYNHEKKTLEDLVR